jgi:hypothetical protein
VLGYWPSRNSEFTDTQTVGRSIVLADRRALQSGRQYHRKEDHSSEFPVVIRRIGLAVRDMSRAIGGGSTAGIQKVPEWPKVLTFARLSRPEKLGELWSNTIRDSLAGISAHDFKSATFGNSTREPSTAFGSTVKVRDFDLSISSDEIS